MPKPLWFKSYGHFTEAVDFAYCWSCIGKGLRLQPAQQACFTKIYLKKNIELDIQALLVALPYGTPPQYITYICNQPLVKGLDFKLAI